MTDMKQNVILNHYETELGCSKPLKNIKNILQNHAGESNQLHINDMPKILEKDMEIKKKIMRQVRWIF